MPSCDILSCDFPLRWCAARFLMTADSLASLQTRQRSSASQSELTEECALWRGRCLTIRRRLRSGSATRRASRARGRAARRTSGWKQRSASLSTACTRSWSPSCCGARCRTSRGSCRPRCAPQEKLLSSLTQAQPIFRTLTSRVVSPPSIGQAAARGARAPGKHIPLSCKLTLYF